MSVESRPANRTWLCSVVFMDIVAYTKHPLTQQIAIKNRFNDIVTSISKKYFSDSDLFLVDSGDGGALCYLGDPEDMLFCTRDLMRAFKSTSDGNQPIPMRIGINLGPVKIHISVSGHPNPIGDGINVAQRVMSFANEGQILISRSFYEVVGCLSEEYASLFEHVGLRSDKHIRKHDLYRVRTTKEVNEVTQAIEEKKKDETEKIANSTNAPNTPPKFIPESKSLRLIQHQLEIALIASIGPIGKIIIQKEFSANNSPTHIIRNLATHIQQEQIKSRFLIAAQGILNSTQSETIVEAKNTDENNQQPKIEKKSFLSAVTQGFIKKPRVQINDIKQDTKQKAQSTTKSTSPPDTEQAPNNTPLWTQNDLAVATKHLAYYVGPLASILVKKSAAQTKDLSELYQKLANNIPQEAERRQFLNKINRE